MSHLRENHSTSLPQNLVGRGNTNPAASQPLMWFLSGRLTPGESPRYVPIHCSPFVVGRQAQAGLSLACKSVSSIHAEITTTGNTLVLRDLNSTNGTYLNGERVRETVELRPDDLVQFANVAFRVLQQSSSCDANTACEDVVDQAMALVQFDRLMNEEAIVPHYQPIVDMADGHCVGHEVLARSRITGMETPAPMFSAASQLNVEAQLSQMVRCKAIIETRSITPPLHLFVNTHPVELERPGLIDALRSLRNLSATQPITLEIHEKAVTRRSSMRELRAALRDMNIGLAFDDFGAGQARLNQLSEVQPDYLKFDISLVHNLDGASKTHQQMIASLVNMARDMDVAPLAEGIETEAERDICVELGFTLGQGFYFGKPATVRRTCDSSPSA